ncbi:GyrI-like domain-containing protein [Zobellia roscoffensis]|uniref:GyrI-like domain-containing protein n=1 Tax=Zobellia roscoffensis TaxID=2779508 RepID=UPI00188D74DE|nr:GyrI-like domain-containing protein [Zobellia roscoffensis]
MRKKIGLILVALVLVALVWYLFIKPNDYTVRFHTKASTGTVNQIAKFWVNQNENASFVTQNNLGDFTHIQSLNDTSLTYNWQVTMLNDSTSQVKVYITDQENSLINRILIPFLDTDFKKRSKNTVKEVFDLLNSHLSNFKTNVLGEAIIPEKYCACVSLKSTQLEKVKGMMENYAKLSGFIAKNNIELDGRPMVAIEKWDVQKDSITYNFCFPIIKSDSLPQKEGIFYKRIEEQKVLKAIYNGNYLTSDRAWYALLDYAAKKKLTVSKTPIEIFHTNPNMGGNELEWKAEIFMPLQAQEPE